MASSAGRQFGCVVHVFFFAGWRVNVRRLFICTRVDKPLRRRTCLCVSRFLYTRGVVRKLGLNSALYGMRTLHRRIEARQLFFFFFFSKRANGVNGLKLSLGQKTQNVGCSCRRSDGPPSPRREAECRSAAGVGNEFQLACVSCHTAQLRLGVVVGSLARHALVCFFRGYGCCARTDCGAKG